MATDKAKRELYIGNLAVGKTTAEEITNLFNESLAPLNKALGSTDPPVVSCNLGPEGKYAFVEMASEKVASAAFQLNEVELNGRPLKVGRPKGYSDSDATAGLKRQRDWDSPSQGGAPSMQQPTNSHSFDKSSKPQRELFVGNLALGQVDSESLSQFFNTQLATLQQPGASLPVIKAELEREGKYAFVEFSSAELATAAITNLNGWELLGRALNIRRPKGFQEPTPSSTAAMWPQLMNQPSPLSQPVMQPQQPAFFAQQQPQLFPQQLYSSGFGSGEAAQAPKTQRELFVGNLAIGTVTADVLRNFFNTGLAYLQQPGGGLPVIDVNLEPGGKYAFVEFQSAEMATAAAQGFNGMDLGGRALNINRPKGFKETAPAQPADFSVLDPFAMQQNFVMPQSFGVQPGYGAVHQQAMNQQTLAPSMLAADTSAVVGEKSQRELFVGNLAIGTVTADVLTQLFNSTLMQYQQPGQGLPVVNVGMQSGGKYAFVELRTPEQATAATQICNGMDLYGRALNIGRPKGYSSPSAGGSGTADGGYTPAAAEAVTGNKSERELFVGNLAIGSVTAQVLQDFFNAALSYMQEPGQGLPVVSSTLESGGKYAFVEMRSPELATAAIRSCNQTDLYGRALNIGRPKGYAGPKDEEEESALVHPNALSDSDTLSIVGDKTQRELFVGNLAIGSVNSQVLSDFFEVSLAHLKKPGSGSLVIKADVERQGKFAFVEFKTPEVANAVMGMSEKVELFGRLLKINRPKGYMSPSEV